MQCPHCKLYFHDIPVYVVIGMDIEGAWRLAIRKCSACNKFIFHLENGEVIPPMQGNGARSTPAFNLSAVFENEIPDVVVKRTFMARPKASSRPPCPIEVPKDIADDYTEACLVLADSPKASAALSRRCLQNLLREVVKVKPDDLAKEIQQVLDSGKLPSYIAEAIDAVRQIGNFAAHPMKGEHSGEVLTVEPEEAEWNLDVLEALFDFYCVQPTIVKRKKDALNTKLLEAGKKPMK